MTEMRKCDRTIMAFVTYFGYSHKIYFTMTGDNSLAGMMAYVANRKRALMTQNLLTNNAILRQIDKGITNG